MDYEIDLKVIVRAGCRSEALWVLERLKDIEIDSVREIKEVEDYEW